MLGLLVSFQFNCWAEKDLAVFSQISGKFLKAFLNCFFIRKIIWMVIFYICDHLNVWPVKQELIEVFISLNHEIFAPAGSIIASPFRNNCANKDAGVKTCFLQNLANHGGCS